MTPEFKVEPWDGKEPRRGRKGQYPWATLQPGQSFLIPQSSRSMVWGQSRRLGKEFHSRLEPDGLIRVYLKPSPPVMEEEDLQTT